MKKKLNCILLIDDDRATNYLNEMIIKKLDCTNSIVVAQSAIEALDYLSSINENGELFPELIFLDINMPAINGWEFLKEFKVKFGDKKDKMKIVMLTTSVNPNDREKASTLSEISYFMNKPLGVNDVQDILKKFLLIETQAFL